MLAVPLLDPVFACFACFPCPLFVFGLLLGSSLAVAPLCCVFLLVFLPAILRLSSLWPLCAALVLWSFLGCCFCCAVGGSPPPLTVVSLPPSVVPLRRPGPVTVLVPPSGYLVASCDGSVALP